MEIVRFLARQKNPITFEGESENISLWHKDIPNQKAKPPVDFFFTLLYLSGKKQ